MNKFIRHLVEYGMATGQFSIRELVAQLELAYNVKLVWDNPWLRDPALQYVVDASVHQEPRRFGVPERYLNRVTGFPDPVDSVEFRFGVFATNSLGDAQRTLVFRVTFVVTVSREAMRQVSSTRVGGGEQEAQSILNRAMIPAERIIMKYLQELTGSRTHGGRHIDNTDGTRNVVRFLVDASVYDVALDPEQLAKGHRLDY